VRPFLLLGAATGLLGCTSAASTPSPPAAAIDAAGAPPASAGRLRPPVLACDRNQLTSWQGRVTGYRRDRASTWLQISTDEDTVEDTTLATAAPPAAPTAYRIDGVAFAESDWARLETADGTLRDGMRAIAWVCKDGVTPPVIDWKPPPA
jgi:hypothetical protein